MNPYATTAHCASNASLTRHSHQSVQLFVIINIINYYYYLVQLFPTTLRLVAFDTSIWLLSESTSATNYRHQIACLSSFSFLLSFSLFFSLTPLLFSLLFSLSFSFSFPHSFILSLFLSSCSQAATSSIRTPREVAWTLLPQGHIALATLVSFSPFPSIRIIIRAFLRAPKGRTLRVWSVSLAHARAPRAPNAFKKNF
jgi:hypothetical protein